MSEVTFCESCEWLHPDSRKGISYRAMCSKYPRLGGMGFVTETLWDKDLPFMLCNGINGGCCPTFEKRREEKE